MFSDDFPPTLLKVVLGVLAIVAIVYGLWYAITYREQVTVLVTDKYWHYYLDVRYDEQHTRIVTKKRKSCSGFGEKEKCTTSSYLDTEHYTDTHIVCKGERDGRELPPLRPELTCEKSGNQYERQDITYHLVFDENGQSKNRLFDVALWDKLRIERSNKIERNIFGDVTDYIGE